MRTRRVVAAISLTAMSVTLASVAACVGDDVLPAPQGSGDASQPETSTADTSTGDTSTADSGSDAGNDARADAAPDSGTDAGNDTGNDAGVPDFCQSAAAVGAAFCVDFQTGADVSVGWDATTASSGASITRNEAFGFNSTRSATIKLGTTNTAQGTLSKTIGAGALKSKVNIQYEGYWVFPAWPANAYNGFLTGITRTQAIGGSSQYYFDIERQPTDWKTTAGNGVPMATLATAISPNAWHHIDMTYDATGASVAIRIIVDTTLVASLSIGKAPGGPAPATFDQLILNAGSENLGAPVTTTEFTFDNVIVRFLP